LVKVLTHEFNLTPQNSIEIFKDYDVILDATDNPATRYLINDTAIFLNKPLISGSSVGWEG
jgi:adenylyltransferase/sulfurtransferase